MNKSFKNRWLDPLIAALLGGAAFALYLSTLAPTVLAGDGGEFQFVPYLLGVAHPTGYPLYTLLGWAWSHLIPLGDVAYRMNLFSAFGAALAVACLYPAAGSLLRQALPGLPALLWRLIAALAAATFAFTPTLWSQAIIAEVYGLHVLIVALLFYLLLSWGEGHRAAAEEDAPPGQGRLLLAAACFGLGLAHHSTTLLLAPAILAYVWLVDRRLFRKPGLVLKALLLVLLPLLLYLYIPLRAPHTPYLRLPLDGERDLVLYENTAANFFRFVTGGPFGGSVDLAVDLGQRLAMALGLLLNEVGVLGLLLALLGALRLALIQPGDRPGRRWALLALTGLAYVASVAFNLVYTIGDIYVMYIPSYLVIVLWMAVGVGMMADLLPVVIRPFKGRRAPAVLLVLFFLAAPILLSGLRYDQIDRSRNTGARSRWQSILAQPLPPDAVLVSNDRNNMMPMWYYQYVDGQRPDLLGLFPLITEDQPTLGHVLDLALSTGRPTYLIKAMPGIEILVDVEAEGRLWRVAGPAAAKEPDYAHHAPLDDALLLVGYDRAPHSPRPGETLRASLYWQALRPLEAEYHTFVHLLDGEGRKVAQSDRQPGGVHYPTSLWRPGERLRDDHLLALPADLAEGVYGLVAGAYTLAGDGTLESLGEPVPLGKVGVKAGAPGEPGALGRPVGAVFDGQIELAGYEAAADAAPKTDVLPVTLTWRALVPPAADYTVFVHLLDAGDQVVAQHDGQPQGGAYPTSVWDAGEVVVDEHRLPLPPDLPAGPYRLRVGLYLLETGQRLPVDDGGDSAELGPVELGH